MKPSSLLWVGLAACFVLVLLYATVVSAPAPAADSRDPSARGAERECVRAVGERVAQARFPFPATVTGMGAARYGLHGMVDGRVAGETVRRNYECVIRYAPAEGYRPDSVRVWQSH